MYDDYWYEPSEFDLKVDEFKEILKKTVSDEIKDRIKFLESELENVQKFIKERDKFILEYNDSVRKIKEECNCKIRQYQNEAEKAKTMRLHKLLGDTLCVGYRPKGIFKQGPKCDKCDEHRYIHFKSPQGRDCKEECECSKGVREYTIEECTLSKIYVRKRDSWSYDEKDDFRNRYYTVDQKEDDYDRYDYVATVYKPGEVVDYNDVNSYYAVFLDKDDCQKYCDWKNEQESKSIG